jgi:hypothetical protein
METFKEAFQMVNDYDRARLRRNIERMGTFMPQLSPLSPQYKRGIISLILTTGYAHPML